MLPVALRVNRGDCEAAMARLARAAGIAASDSPDAVAAECLVERVDAICRRLGVPGRLGDLGVAARHVPDLVRDSRGNSMDGNPRALSDHELTQILEARL
jgi:alcohol dehydrogenase class IV